MRTILVIAAVLTLSACAGTKSTVPPQREAPFEVGKTTLQEVIEALGKPNESISHADGSRSILYSRTETRVNAETIISHIGKFRGGSELVNSSASMRFNKDGILISFSAASGKTSLGSSPFSSLASGSVR